MTAWLMLVIKISVTRYVAINFMTWPASGVVVYVVAGFTCTEMASFATFNIFYKFGCGSRGPGLIYCTVDLKLLL